MADPFGFSTVLDVAIPSITRYCARRKHPTCWHLFHIVEGQHPLQAQIVFLIYLFMFVIIIIMFSKAMRNFFKYWLTILTIFMNMTGRVLILIASAFKHLFCVCVGVIIYLFLFL